MSKHIIRTEYLKLKGNMSFKVMAIFFIVFLPVIILTLPTIVDDSPTGPYPFLPRDYETTWYFTAYVASWFSLFILSFILIFHITNEYTNKTVRQNIIDGYSRSDFFKSKFYMLIVMAIVATIYVFIVGLVAGVYFQTFNVPSGLGINTSNISADDLTNPLEMIGKVLTAEPEIRDFGTIWDGVESVLSYFVQVLAYFIFAIFIAFSFRRGAVSVILYYALFFVEFLSVSILEYNDLQWLADNLPLRTFSLVLPTPGINNIMFGLTSVDTLDLYKVTMSVVYMIVFLIITRIIFGKRDVA